MPTAAQPLAARLAALRQRRGLTQRQLAARLDCSHVQVARWETGKHEPTVATLRRLAEALEIKLEQLLT